MILTMKDKQRIETIQYVMDHRLTIEEATRVLHLSERQIFRMLKRLRTEGLSGLLHKNRGRPNPRKLSLEQRQHILDLVQDKYRDINDTHLSEVLARAEKIHISRECLRRILRHAHLPPKRKRRSPKYRSRRPRREAFGMMLQIDASPHDWLQDRGPPFTLVGAKDDATGYVWAHFVESETTWAYLDLMREVFSSHGLPLSLYSDRHTIFHSPREPSVLEQLYNQKPFTQFGRAMHQLGISIIKAYSPEAKGRIERQWGVFQDRLVVELRLAHASTIQHANAVLKNVLKDSNQRFTVPPKQQTSVFRKPPATTLLNQILCIKETRTVAKDHTVSFEGITLQIPPSKKFRSLAGQKVEVLQLQNGSVEIVCRRMLVARFSEAVISHMLQSNPSPLTTLKMVA
jgi:Transposase and inactivated derivatives